MNMWQLFKHLPRDLRWEVLSEFVGSHAVRKGKLIRKMVVDDRHQLIQDIPRINRCYIWYYIRNFNATDDGQLRSGSQLMFCDNPKTGEMGFLFRKRIPRTHSREEKRYGHIYTPMNDSVTLPPFEKHSYPSYEDTDKKKSNRRPRQKPLSLSKPSEEKDIIQPSSPPPRSPDSPPPRSPDGPPPPISHEGYPPSNKNI